MKRICPSCYKEISDDSKFCPECGFNISLSETANLPINREMTISKSPKKSKAPQKALMILVLVTLVVSSIFIYNNVLWGKDKIAFDLIVEYATSFKDPSSIQLISGCAGTDDDNKGYAFLCLSAKNGFGGATMGYYSLNSLGISDLEDDQKFYESAGLDINTDYMIDLCKERSQLNTKKINRALQREWKSIF